MSFRPPKMCKFCWLLKWRLGSTTGFFLLESAWCFLGNFLRYSGVTLLFCLGDCTRAVMNKIEKTLIGPVSGLVSGPVSGPVPGPLYGSNFWMWQPFKKQSKANQIPLKVNMLFLLWQIYKLLQHRNTPCTN